MRKRHMLIEEKRGKPARPKEEAARQPAKHQPGESQPAVSSARATGLAPASAHWQSGSAAPADPAKQRRARQSSTSRLPIASIGREVADGLLDGSIQAHG